jgi:hypothetical protein
MADQPQSSDNDSRPDKASADRGAVSLGELIELVKTYVRQETLGPLRGAGRWLAFGTAAAVVLGLGLTLMTLGLLRLLQTEWERSATGRMSWLSYLIVFVVVISLLLLTVTRISKKSLNKESY